MNIFEVFAVTVMAIFLGAIVTGLTLYNLWIIFSGLVIYLFTPKKDVPECGMKAYYDGFLLEDNPYPQYSANHSIWRDDWLFSAGRFR